jgi:WD40 repeat protein
MNATVNGSGDILSISGDFGGHVHSYDLRDGERLSTIEINRNRAPGIRFLPGHNMLATIGYDSVLRFWNVKSGARIGPEVRNFGECSVVSFSADGTLCAIAQPDQTVKLLRMPQATTKASATVDRESAGLPFEPSMDRSGRWFVPQSARWSAPVRELCVYETSTGRPCSATVVLSPEIISTAISADGILVAAVTAMPGTPAVKQNGNLERYSRRPGQVRIWDWLNNQFLGEPINTKTLPMDCAFSPDGTKLVVVCAFGKVLRIDVEQPKVDLETAHPGSTNYGYLLPKRMIRFSEEGDRFITAGIGKSVRVWTSEGKLLGELKHKNYVLDANFSTAGDYLVTACEDGIVNIWDARSCKAIGTPLKHPGKVNSATFDPSGEFIATVCSNRMVSVWDWRHSKRVCPDLEHTSNVYSASFNVDGKLLITAADNKVRFWERFTGRQVSSPRVVNTFTTLLVMNRKSQVAVVSSSRQSSVEPPRLASVYHTHELAPLDGLGFPSENLRTLAEIVSGRRIENGGSTALTSDQWWGRWEMSHPPVKEIVPLLSLVFIGVCVSSL